MGMIRCVGGPSDGVQIDAERYPDEFAIVRDPVLKSAWRSIHEGQPREWSELFQRWLAPKMSTKYRRSDMNGETVFLCCE
jgi:hypothetical protein